MEWCHADRRFSHNHNRLLSDKSFVKDLGGEKGAEVSRLECIHSFAGCHTHFYCCFALQSAVFLVMTQDHFDDLPPAWQGRAFRILEVLGRMDEGDIADPYFDGNYESAFRDIRACVDTMLVWREAAAATEAEAEAER